ncbi:MAG: N-acetylmuramoyl-L-alanine amidase [Alphaproteobacteria bacterium]|jgi:N-acetylmuramoyl-L-alanine amidase
MLIKRHRLYLDTDTQAAFKQSPNQSGALNPTHLIIHFTAGASAQSSIDHLTRRGSSASAHLVIARDGTITQLVPFNRIAWHAGRSRWENMNGMNKHSIGIEIDNAGELSGSPGRWQSWFGRTYADDDVVFATHQSDSAPTAWHRYTEAQLAATTTASAAIVEHYDLIDVLGHDDISPGRKRDPGPAFPMENFRSMVIGREEDVAELRKTTTELNIRTGPGVEFAKLEASPLAKGTPLRIEARKGVWRHVEVLNKKGEPEHTGWVHGNYIA